ncbi:MAG: prephenate dehydrogenase [Chloroflexi bacterium]|nr:MAG: prephenate dehydrogenase [Chloroflexota bacterium]
MADVSIAILGLGRIGASIGLALQRYNNSKDAKNHFTITAADTRPIVVDEAKDLNVAEKIIRKPLDAAREQDIVVIALPYAEVEALYEYIGDDLREGTVIMDMSILKTPSLKWAEKYLPSHAHLVGMTPVINPAYLYDGLEDTQNARADLFDKGNMLLMPSPTCVTDAVELASDFSALLGATPHFLDPAEHDSLIAATEGIPALLGTMTFYILQRGAGWHDAQRLTNSAFGKLTHHLFDTHPDDIRDFFHHNRDNTLRYLDEMINGLTAFRAILAENDKDALEATLIEAADEYKDWVNRRYRARWEDEDRSIKTPTMGEIMGGAVGGFLTNRFSNKDDDED